jgi:hypothetical protein
MGHRCGKESGNETFKPRQGPALKFSAGQTRSATFGIKQSSSGFWILPPVRPIHGRRSVSASSRSRPAMQLRSDGLPVMVPNTKANYEIEASSRPPAFGV